MTRALEGQQIALVDLLDRVLAGGVVVSGEITLCIADIDLVRISLRALVASVTAVAPDRPAPGYRDRGAEEGGPGTVGKETGEGRSQGGPPR